MALSSGWARWRPQRIDRYVLGEIGGPFLGGVLFFTFVFLMAQTLRWAELFIVHGLSASMLFRMIAYIILSFVPFILPPAFLVGVLVGFGRLSSDSELVAMKANGFGVGRLFVSVVAAALALCALCLALNTSWAPEGERQLYRTLVRIGNTQVNSAIREGAFVSGFFDLLLFTDKYDAKTHKMQRVFIFDERDPRQPVVVVAPEGELWPVKTDSELSNAVLLKLRNGNIHRSDPEQEAYTKIDFGEYRLFLKIDAGADNAPTKPRMLPQDALRKRIQEVGPTSNQGRELRAELWRRYSLAMTPLVFAILGVAFGIVPTRSVRAGAALVGFVAVLLYWGLLTVAMTLAQKEGIPPWLATQLPNAVLGGIGIFVLARVNR